MNIDRHNCEAFFLDYYEGNLSPVKVGEMLVFLEENPDLKDIFEEYEHTSIAEGSILFPVKEEMKKKYNAEGIESLLSSEVTADNCEQFFIAFVEGQLSPERISRMNAFIAANPVREKEFELFKRCKLTAETVSFEHKQELKKDLITEQNREEYFIRAIENDLNAAEQQELDVFLKKNPAYKKELEQFQKTILVSETISFPEKSSLKKKERKPVFVSLYSQRSIYYAAAATILLLAGLFFVFRNNDNTDKQLFAGKTNPAPKESVRMNNIAISVKKDNVENPAKENGQKTAPQIKESGSIRPKASNPEHVLVKKNSIPVPSETRKEEIKLQPVLSEDIADEKLVAQEEPQLQMMKEETISAQANHPEEKMDAVKNIQPAVAAKSSAADADTYQSLSAFVTKKVRALLGVKNENPCATSDRLSWWDLAMAAKGGVQRITGTKAIDVNKVCDGTGNKVEYVFAAGNFEFSKSAAK